MVGIYLLYTPYLDLHGLAIDLDRRDQEFYMASFARIR